MSTINTIRATKQRVAPTTIVSLKTNWHDQWIEQPQLFANRRRYGVSPAGSSAEVEHRYGFGKEFDSQQYAEVQPLLINGQFVKIEQDLGDEADANDVFVGLLQVEQQSYFGSVADENGADTLNGQETYQAVGLELLLQRKRLTESIVQTADGEQRIGRALAFNKFDGAGLIAGGNAADETGDQNTAIFCSTLANSSSRRWWTAREIIEYLLAYHAPGNGVDEADIDWQLTGDTSWLDAHTPALDVQGRMLSEVLDQLINPRRGACWWVAVNGETVEVRVASFSDQAITLASSQPVLSANANLVDLIADKDPAVLGETHVYSNAARYDRVTARGARLGCLFSVSIEDGTLVADWSSTDESAYKAAASGEGDYPADTAAREERNDNFRQTDALAHVYTRFVLPDPWDGLCGDGIGGIGTQAIPVLGELTAAELEQNIEVDTFWRPGLRFQRTLPLQTATDYSGEVLGAVGTDYTEIDGEASTLPDGGPAELLTPFAVLQIEDGTPDRYQYVERLAGSRDDLEFSCTLRMLDNAPGISIEPEGPNHLIASADFTSAAPTAHAAVLDFNSLIATVYLSADRQVEARYPSDEDLAGGGFVFGGNDVAALSELVIEAGDDYRVERVAVNTVVGLADGELVHSEGGLIRDDRQRLATIARLAYQWYQRERAAVQLTWRSVSNFPPLGSYLRTIDGGGVDTVVTSIEHDFRRGTTTIHTSFAELDFIALVG